jgi:hypothetical protein
MISWGRSCENLSNGGNQLLKVFTFVVGCGDNRDSLTQMNYLRDVFATKLLRPIGSFS